MQKNKYVSDIWSLGPHMCVGPYLIVRAIVQETNGIFL